MSERNIVTVLREHVDVIDRTWRSLPPCPPSSNADNDISRALGNVYELLTEIERRERRNQSAPAAHQERTEPKDACLRCGRVASDLIHDNPNDHGWTGTGAMHPFVDERGKWLLQWTAKRVFLYGKSGHKGTRLTDDQVKWNEAIGKAESVVAEMFAPFTSEELAEHDRYFADEKRTKNHATSGNV